jgi:non-canonical purine NTP pyrophosphatase (RdgB/HAM1 family)
MKIFVSYARVDKARVLELVQALKIHDVWFDDRLNLGQEWWSEIERQIAACNCFMFAISPESLASEYCQKELEVARKLGKPVAPVLLKPAAVPEDLNRLHIITFTDGLTPESTIGLLNGLFEIERVVFNPLRHTNGASKTSAARLSLADLTFVTINANKKHDYEQILGVELQVAPIDLLDMQHLDPGEVALEKVRRAYQMLRRPVIVEQSGLAVRAWGGLPGGMSSAFLQPIGMMNFCRMLTPFDDRYAEAIAAIAFSDGSIQRKFVGVLPGTIAERPRGEGYSWRTIFIPQGFTQTLAEMSAEAALSISMRRRAILDFMRFLQATYSVE